MERNRLLRFLFEHILFKCLVLGVFFFMCSTSIQKYLAGKTYFDATTVDVDEIQYPSISVCRKYAMDNIDAFAKLLTNDSLTSKKKPCYGKHLGKR